MRPRLLDLCCGAGLAADGYDRVGFDVYGVDINPQPNYPFRFAQRDALEVLKELIAWRWGFDFDAIHASFPCQAKTDYRRKGHGVGEGYPNLIPEGRELLERTGLPYVIENVEGFRADMRDPVRVCGTSFASLDVQRHRLFESNVPIVGTPCQHSLREPRYPGATNRGPNSRRTVEIGVWRIPLDVQRRAMGVDRDVSLAELSQGIPPAYTEHIGRQLLAHLEKKEEEIPTQLDLWEAA